VEAGYSGDAHRTSITVAAERALSDNAAMRTRLVPSPPASDPRSYPLLDTAASNENAQTMTERDLHNSLSLVGAAASLSDSLVASFRAINGSTFNGVLLI
jgi:hypothetical protein